MQYTGNSIETPIRIDPAVEMGSVTLKVADLARSLEFYTGVIGLGVIEKGSQTAVLGTGTSPLLILFEVPGAIKQPEYSTGLYHAAILLPTRRALAVKARQLLRMRYPIGQGDHLVSEALYLSDPDGNGLEIYRDRPRSEWQWDGQTVRMATDPVDFDSLLAEIPADDPDNILMPAGTKLGHMHLRVGNIPIAERFYHGLLGFDVVASMHSALFVSAGGYHHHIGMNIWQSRGASPAGEKSVGLRSFSILMPNEVEQARLEKRLNENGVSTERIGDAVVLNDPWQNEIHLVVKGS